MRKGERGLRGVSLGPILSRWKKIQLLGGNFSSNGVILVTTEVVDPVVLPGGCRLSWTRDGVDSSEEGYSCVLSV